MKEASKRGFTLIELMIAVAIVGILAAVAIPSYMSQTRKNRRADAFSAITAIEQAEERWRANNTSYTSALTTASPNGLGLSSTSTGGYYTLAVSATSGTGYTVTATAVSGKSQASDTGCTTLEVVVSNGAPTPSQSSCWSR